MTIVNQQVWISGNSNFVVTIPKKIRTILNIEIGDILELEIKSVIRPNKLKIKEFNEYDPSKKTLRKYKVQ